ncbi:MAG TPA: NADH-quinone oxidoreductase subunit N [Opitutaceae bacterium]|nr:NADH-quinone oxidoreductase subunit N [Opitutaceae bacterium]
MTADYSGLAGAVLPEAALTLGALIVLGVDLVFLRRQSLAIRLRFAVAAAALAVVAAIALTLKGGAPGEVFGGVLIFDSLAMAVRLGVLTLVLLVLGISLGAPRPRRPAEYVAIMLFAAVGFNLMAAAQQLLLAFLALELASLSLYVLAGFDKSRPESVEAALKYFLFGGVSAAFLLFGFSLIYGLTGSINLPQIAASLAQQGLTPLLAVALVMVLVAFGFKAAAAPFHLWAPDAYQGAPAPSAALIASASKLAGLALFVRLLWPGFHAVAGNIAVVSGGGWLPVVAILAGASLLLGNIGALAQTNVRRLLAYSAIAHAGALLLGVIAFGVAGPAPLFYYAMTYGVATAGAFGVIAVLERAGGCDKITDLAGLHRRSPFLAACLAVFILSLAGIPPLAGFFGKLAVFAAALQLGAGGPAGWLTFAAIFLSAVALYYYLVILKQAWVAPPAEKTGPVAIPLVTAFTFLAAAAIIVLAGLWPSFLLDFF